VIPNPALPALVAVEHGGGPLGDGLGTPTEALHIARRGGRPGVPDELGYVLQRLVTFHPQVGYDGAAPGVGGDRAGVDPGRLGCLLHDLGHGLAQYQASGGRGEHEVDDLALVPDLRPDRGGGPLLLLGHLALGQQCRHRGHEEVLAHRPIGLGRAKALALAVHVDRRPPDLGRAAHRHQLVGVIGIGGKVEVDVFPGQAQDLRDTPPLEEQ
jgi:hypothetical protein